MRRTLAVLLFAGLVVLAGCSGGPGTGTGTDGTDGTNGGHGTATVNFWVSDRPGAIDDFEHLNVTVTRVGFKPTNGTANGSANGTGWVERDINETTVDLTELTGTNATLADSVEVPNGTYTKTVMYVSEVNGTTTDGDHPSVKLPSEKLQLNSEFTVGANESVDFVFDIKVTKAGNSGKYVIRPVISQSGVGQPIDDVSDRERKQGGSGNGNESDASGSSTNHGNGNGNGNGSGNENANGKN